MAYKVFLSSPSDVMPERKLCGDVVARINAEQGDGVQLELIRWEETYYSAFDTFQTQIPRAGECDIVICIFWKALGTELPDTFDRPDGSSRTGTEYEFEDAMEAAEAQGNGLPDILVYKKDAAIYFSQDDLQREQLQFKSFKQFWQRWFYSEKGHFLAAFHTFDTPESFAAQLEKHLRLWLANQSRDVTWTAGSPYPGLRSFDVADAPLFFGRRREVERLRARLIRAMMAGKPFLLVSGPSGSGKSSLLRAGLIPRLAQPGGLAQLGDGLCWAIVTPAQIEVAPWQGLAAAFFAHEGLALHLKVGDFETVEALAGLLGAGGGAALAPLAKALERRDAAEAGLIPEKAKLVLMLDQLEEIVKWDKAQAGRLIDLVDAMVSHPSGRFVVLASARSDSVHALGRLAVLRRLIGLDEVRGAEAVDTTMEIAPIAAADLRDIIRKPAEAAGLSFDKDPESGEDLAALIEAEAAPDVLPAVQYLLSELYAQREGTRLTFAAYHALGGVRGVMAKRGDAVLASCDAQSRAAFPRVVRGLVKFDASDGPPLARRMRQGAFAEGSPEQRLLTAMTEARLLISDGVSLRLAHESLFEGWQTLTACVQQDRRMLDIRDRLLPYARRFEAAPDAGSARTLHLTGFQLAEARALREAWGADGLAEAHPALPAFIDASHRADRRRVWRRAALAWGLAAVFAACAVGLYGLWTQSEERRISAQAALALVEANAATADGNDLLAARRASAAYALIDTPVYRSATLTTLLSVSPHLISEIDTGRDVRAIAFTDPDLLAVADEKGALSFHDASGTEPRVRIDLGVVPHRLFPLPSGLLVVSDTGAVHLIRRDGENVALGTAQGGGPLLPDATSVAVDVSGGKLKLGLAMLFGLIRGDCGPVLEPAPCTWTEADSDPVRSVALAGRNIAAVQDHGEAMGVVNNTIFFGPSMRAAALSADGRHAAFTYENGDHLVVHPQGTESRHALSRMPISVLAFSPVDYTLALACDARDLCLHAPGPSGRPLVTRLTGHRAPVRDLVWSADGQNLASVDAEGRVRLWTRAPQPGGAHGVLTGLGAGLRALAARPDGQEVVAGDARGAVLHWPPGRAHPQVLSQPGQLQGAIRAVAWAAPDRIAAVSEISSRMVWLRTDAPGSFDPVGTPGALHRLAAEPGRGAVVAPLRNGRVAFAFPDGRVTELPPAFPDAERPPAAYGAGLFPGGDAALVSYVDGSFVRHPLDGATPEVIVAASASAKAIGSSGVSLAPDGEFFAASQGDYAFHLYPLDPPADPIRVPIASPDTVDVTFNPTGTRLAALGADGALYIYRFENGAPRHNLTLNSLPSTGAVPGPETVTALVWLDAERLALAMSGGNVRVVSLDEAIWKNRLSGLRLGD